VQEVGATPKGRKELAEKAGIGDTLILKWVNQTDLAQVEGWIKEARELPRVVTC
jgi:hypothetical protein